MTEAAFLGRILVDPPLETGFATAFGADLADGFGEGLTGVLEAGLVGFATAFALTTGAFFLATGLEATFFAADLGGALVVFAGAGFDLGATFTGALLFLESFDFFEADDTAEAFLSGTLLFLDLDAIRKEM